MAGERREQPPPGLRLRLSRTQLLPRVRVHTPGRAAAILVLTPYVCLTGGSHLLDMDALGVINLLVVGVFHTGICYCMYFSSLRYLKGQEAAMFFHTDPFQFWKFYPMIFYLNISIDHICRIAFSAPVF